MTRKHRSTPSTPKNVAYWRRNVTVTSILLVLWFIVTFVVAFYADELNRFRFLDFPLGFYMGAQGSLLIYLLIIWFYARYMNALDEKFDQEPGVSHKNEKEDRSPGMGSGAGSA